MFTLMYLLNFHILHILPVWQQSGIAFDFYL